MQMPRNEVGDTEARARAIRHFEAGDYPAAVELLAGLLERHPSDVILLRFGGMALVRTGAAPAGLPHLTRARALAPDDAVVALWHGIALHAADRPADAPAGLDPASPLAPAPPAPRIHQ